MTLTVLLPVYNGELFLRTAVNYSKILDPDEIIIVEDGSRDESHKLALQLASVDDRIIVSHRDERSGKGGAIKRGVSLAKGENVLLTDVDFPCRLGDVERLIKLLTFSDVAVALRIRDFPFHRRLMSWGFGSLTLLFFYINLDFQSGVLAFKREVGQRLLEQQEIMGFSWSTEFLVRALKRGYRISEVTAPYVYKNGSTVGLSSVPKMFTDLIRIWRNTK